MLVGADAAMPVGQCPGAFGVVGVGVQLRVEAEVALVERLVRRRVQAPQHLLGDLGTVDGQADRAPDADVVERGHAGVQHDAVRDRRQRQLPVVTLLAERFGHRVHRRRHDRRVVPARAHAVEAGVGIGDGADREFRGESGVAIPVAVPALVDDVGVLGRRHERVRPGPGGFRRQVGAERRRVDHHPGRAVGERPGQAGVGVGQVEHDVRRVDDLDAVEGGDPSGDGGVRACGALHVRGDGLGVEPGAALERHVVAQGEGDAAPVRRDLVGGGELRGDLRPVGALGQGEEAVVDRPHPDGVGRVDRPVRVEGVHPDAAREPEPGVAVGRRGGVHLRGARSARARRAAAGGGDEDERGHEAGGEPGGQGPGGRLHRLSLRWSWREGRVSALKHVSVHLSMLHVNASHDERRRRRAAGDMGTRPDGLGS